MQLNRLTPQLIKDFKAHTHDKKFGIEFLSADRPQMRTVLPQHHIRTYDEITTLLRSTVAPFVILQCICRKKKTEVEPPKTREDFYEIIFARDLRRATFWVCAGYNPLKGIRSNTSGLWGILRIKKS